MSAAPRIDVLGLFPEWIRQFTEIGVVGRAMRRRLLHCEAWQLRDFADDVHRTVDDRTYGGGPGMVMLIEPLRRALTAIRAADPRPAHTIYLSPQGRVLDQAKVRELASRPRLVLLCGRYEGVDERLLDAEVDEEISIGDYVLSGGEPAACVLIDAVGRLVEGALNDPASAAQDSFEDGLLDCPHFTRPEQHELGTVPAVLTSGDHKAIARWRRQQSLGRTWQRRPDLLEKIALSRADQALLDQFRLDLQQTEPDAD
ncbi:MAG: tRNA (guanosine(37)-N1)-methyltransferase TrmD [Xanthomonadales bacterium]|nr:tRNA (guanosine(37)-N1)-methyltransferase TrmD [Xanthomonadales bacterium]